MIIFALGIAAPCGSVMAPVIVPNRAVQEQGCSSQTAQRKWTWKYANLAFNDPSNVELQKDLRTGVDCTTRKRLLQGLFFYRCQGKVEMSPCWQSRNVPFCGGL